MKKIFYSVLIAVLAGSLAAVSCTSDIRNDIDRVEETVAATDTKLQDQIDVMKAALQAYKDEVNPKLKELTEADAALRSSLNSSYEELTTALGTKVSEEDFQEAVAAFQSKLDELIEAQAQAVIDQAARDAAQEEKDAAQDKALEDALAAQDEKDAAQDKALADAIAAQTLALQTLEIRVETYKTDLETALDTRIKAIETAIAANIEALDKRIAANEAALKKLEEETIPALAERIKACEDILADLATASSLEEFKTATNANLDTINELCATLNDSKLDKATYNAFIATFDTWKGSVDEKLQSLDGQLDTMGINISKLQEILDILEEELAILKTDDEPGYITLQVYVEGIRDALSAEIDAIKAQIEALSGDVSYEDAIAALNEAIQAKLSEMLEQIAILKARVQSLVFVPQYKDLRFGIPFSKLTDGDSSIAVAYNDPENHFDVVYRVVPDSLAASLAEHAKEVFNFVIEGGLQTRIPAPIEDPKLTIESAEGDVKSGKITFKLSHKDFIAYIDENDEPVIDEYAISLEVSDTTKGIHVASGYTGTITLPSPVIMVDTVNIYKLNPTDSTNVVAYTKRTNEYKQEVQYIDSTSYYPYKDCYLTASISTDSPKVQYTYEQLKELGYNVPATSIQVSTTTADDKCAFLKHGALDTVKFATVQIDSTKALKLVKEHLVDSADVHSKKLNYAYGKGFGDPMNMSATITLGKVDSLDFVIKHKMAWTYAADKEADHKNFGGTATNYSHSKLVSVPVLMLGGEEILLDGSDKAYGIVAEDFVGSSFTKAAGATVPANLVAYDYGVEEAADTTVTMKSITISSWGTADALDFNIRKAQYDVAGSYVLPFSKVSTAKVAVSAVDRNRTAIDLTLKPFNVTLLGGASESDGGVYIKSANDEHYVIRSANLAGDVYGAYVKQGIFTPESYSQRSAFGSSVDSEFLFDNVVWTNTTDTTTARFKKALLNDVSGGALYLESNDTTGANKQLNSKVLADLSQNYAADGSLLPQADSTKMVKYSFYSYIGQTVNLYWPILAKPAANYMYTTYGALENKGNYYFNISPSSVWVKTPDAITKAKTELDLIWNSNIQIVTGTNGEGGVNPVNFKERGLVPVFSLSGSVDPTAGVVIKKDSLFASNVRYYSQLDSVAVTCALFVESGPVLFSVPGGESMYLNYSDRKIDSVFVRKFNPVAEAARQQLDGNVIIPAGTSGVLPLTLLDMNGNGIYKNGYAQNNKGKYKASISDIFGDITFTLLSVNGEQEYATGWTVTASNAYPSVKLSVPSGLADGLYPVEIGVHTYWQDYKYTFVVRCGSATGSVEGTNPDYVSGGSETWN